MQTHRAPDRLDWVDLAKGLGILLVVFGHVWRGLASARLPIPPHQFHAIDQFLYSFHMPLFFLISGLFVFRSATAPLKSFLARIFGSIAYPYVLWTVIFVGFRAAFVSYTNTKIDAAGILRTFLWIPHEQFWFLYALMLCLVLLNFIARLPGRVPLIIAAAATARILFELGVLPAWTPLLRAAEYLPFVALGAVMAPVVLDAAPRLKLPLLGSLVLLYVAVPFAARIAPQPAGLAAIPGIVATLALALLLTRIPLASRSFTLMGRASLAIYVAHVIPAAALRILLQKLHIHSIPLHLLLGVSAGVLAPLALFVWTQRHRFPYVFTWPRYESPPGSGRAPA